jgi:toxin ParE1/3/4
MACKIVWSPASRDDLRDIVRFIARDNPRRAESFAYQIIAQIDVLQKHPEIGPGDWSQSPLPLPCDF